MKSLISDVKSLILNQKIIDFKTVKIIDSESENIDFREKKSLISIGQIAT